MRVISGMRRGLKLKAPDGMGTRPTTDRVKESVFNLIQSGIPADTVLDLFSGSGALGIEALSRGSGKCIFVDSSKDAAALTEENITLARFNDRAEIEICDAIGFLNRCKTEFDLIFLDPPYNHGLLKPVIGVVFDCRLLKRGGIIVAETECGGEDVPDIYYPVKKSVTYGKTLITILQG